MKQLLAILLSILPVFAWGQSATGPYGVYGGPIPSASLPTIMPPNTSGTIAFTADQGEMLWNGSAWVQQSGTAGALTPTNTATVSNKDVTDASNKFAGFKTATTVVCASNTLNTSGCDIRLTGTADDTTINAAIGTPSGTAYCAVGGCKFLFRDGTYVLNGSACRIVAARSGVALEGESQPMPGQRLQTSGWVNTSSPVYSLTGATGALFESGCAGTGPLIIDNNTNVPDNGNSYHQGIRIQNLALIGGVAGSGYSNSTVPCLTVSGSAASWNVTIEHNLLMRCDACYSVAIHTGKVGPDNLCTDISGQGVVFNTGSDELHYQGNVIADIGGAFGSITDINYQISGNTFTRGQAPLSVSGKGVVGSNSFGAMGGTGTQISCAGNTAIRNNVFNAGNNSYGQATRSAPIIVEVATATCPITNNYLQSAVAGENAGVYAIDTSATSGAYVSDNTIVGSWNNAGLPIHYGSGNFWNHNQGDPGDPDFNPPTSPTGFGTGAALTASGSKNFVVVAGTSGATTLSLTMPASDYGNGWSCTGFNNTTGLAARQSGYTVSSVTFAINTIPTSGDKLTFSCGPF